jgi:hypothetical protein
MKEWKLLIELDYIANVKGLESHVKAWIEASPGRIQEMHEAIEKATKFLKERDINITVIKWFYNSETRPRTYEKEVLKIWHDANNKNYTIRKTYESIGNEDQTYCLHGKRAEATKHLETAITKGYCDCMQYNINIFANSRLTEEEREEKHIFINVPDYNTVFKALWNNTQYCRTAEFNGLTPEQKEQLTKVHLNNLYNYFYVSMQNNKNLFKNTPFIEDIETEINSPETAKTIINHADLNILKSFIDTIKKNIEAIKEDKTA